MQRATRPSGGASRCQVRFAADIPYYVTLRVQFCTGYRARRWFRYYRLPPRAFLGLGPSRSRGRAAVRLIGFNENHVKCNVLASMFYVNDNVECKNM